MDTVATEVNTSAVMAGCVDLLEHDLFSEELNGTTSASINIDPWINFAFNGVGILLLAVVGIPANVVSVIVLSHPKLKSSLTTLLLGLTVSDIFVIGTSLLIFSLSPILDTVQALSWYTTIVRPHLLPWLLPIALTAQMSSLYFTVIITLERYIAVCLPLRARSLCTRSSAKKCAFIVLLVSFLYNIPRWFEYETVPVLENCTADHLHQQHTYRETETDFRRGEKYILYYVNWAYLIVLYLIPFTILLQFNAAIYRMTKRHRSRRNSLSPTAVTRANEDAQLAAMLFGIVLTFIACNMLALVINVMESFGVGEIGNLIPINNFLIVLSSSSNFVFYCVFGTEFRKRLKQTLRITRGSTKSQSRRVPSYGMAPSSLAEQAQARVKSREDLPKPTASIVRRSNDSNNNGSRRSGTSQLAVTQNPPEILDGIDIPTPRSTRSCSQITVDSIISEDL